jgi:hypothetical protein
LSKGREAVSGLSFLSDSAFIELNPPIAGSETEASAPPDMMISAFPKRIIFVASTIALFEDAQAETVA